jgi:hypothetical protein
MKLKPKSEYCSFAYWKRERNNRKKLSGVLADADNDFHSFASLAKEIATMQI